MTRVWEIHILEWWAVDPIIYNASTLNEVVLWLPFVFVVRISFLLDKSTPMFLLWYTRAKNFLDLITRKKFRVFIPKSAL
jgi:hypothetical protein